MPMNPLESDKTNFITKLLCNEDISGDFVTLLERSLLECNYHILSRVYYARMNHEKINIDWFNNEFLEIDNYTKYTLPKNNYPDGMLQNLFDDQIPNFSITLKYNSVSVELNISESLIIINTLAVKRAQLRDGAWSTLGKQIEKPLMQTLCALFDVPKEHYRLIGQTTSDGREVDFYLINGVYEYPCEVKLMGKGNPEVADAIFARQSAVFIADKLSDLNKSQAESLGIKWVELSAPHGYQKFYEVLQSLNIPSKPFDGDLDTTLSVIFSDILAQTD